MVIYGKIAVSGPTKAQRQRGHYDDRAGYYGVMTVMMSLRQRHDRHDCVMTVMTTVMAAIMT